MRVVELKTEDGLGLLGWYKPPAATDGKLVVLFHGNAGNIGHRAHKARRFLDALEAARGDGLADRADADLLGPGHGLEVREAEPGDEGRAVWAWHKKLCSRTRILVNSGAAQF